MMSLALQRGLPGRLLALYISLWVIGILPAAAAELTLLGQWQVNDDLSDDIKDAFDGKLRRGGKGEGISRPGVDDDGRPRGGPEVAQDNYWSAVQDTRERRSMRDLARLGTAYPLLTIEHMEIKSAGDDFMIVYDKLLPRQVRPNPGGRAYSAKGDELVVDSLGYTLSYWDKAELVLETDAPDGGRFIERLKLAGEPARIEYSIRIKMPVLTEPVTVKRVFERAAP